MADNEYIKRSEVVDLIESKIKRCVTVPGAFVCASLRTAVMGLRNADVAPRAAWISVEERLPERELQELMRMNPLKVFPCLVVITSDYYNKAYVSQAYYAEEGFISGDSGLITERITHWMPLPEPPKGDHHE